MNARKVFTQQQLLAVVGYVALVTAVLASGLGLLRVGIEAGLPPLVAMLLSLGVVTAAGVQLWAIEQRNVREGARLIVERDRLYRGGEAVDSSRLPRNVREAASRRFTFAVDRDQDGLAGRGDA